MISPRAPGSCVADWLYACDIHDRKFICSLMTVPRSRMQPRAKTDCGRGRIKDMTMIDKRPAGAGDRTELGHWEDLAVLGLQGSRAVGHDERQRAEDDESGSKQHSDGKYVAAFTIKMIKNLWCAAMFTIKRRFFVCLPLSI